MIDRFVPERLTVARQLRGLTMKRLAERCDVTPVTISNYERGEHQPTQTHLERLAATLNVDTTFFHRDIEDVVVPDEVSFRALRRTSARKQHEARASLRLAMDFVRWVEDTGLRLPRTNIPDLGGAAPEEAAIALRQHWGLGLAPIRNAVQLLETHGVRVFSLIETCREVDAFAAWSDSAPFVLLSTDKSAERGRFDACHELGHLCLHQHGQPTGQEAESQANAFASAFLMPRETVIEAYVRRPSLDYIVKAKRRWGTSVAALVYRLSSLGLLSEWEYRTLNVELSSLGYRTQEPNSIPRETSAMIPLIFDRLGERGFTRKHVVDALGLSEKDLAGLLFGLRVITGGTAREGSSPVRGHLRLVE